MEYLCTCNVKSLPHFLVVSNPDAAHMSKHRLCADWLVKMCLCPRLFLTPRPLILKCFHFFWFIPKVCHWLTKHSTCPSSVCFILVALFHFPSLMLKAQSSLRRIKIMSGYFSSAWTASRHSWMKHHILICRSRRWFHFMMQKPSKAFLPVWGLVVTADEPHSL